VFDGIYFKLWQKLYFELLLFLVVMVMYVRYRQVNEYHRIYAPSPWVLICNKHALWIGFLSCLGLSVVANFQTTNVRVVHLIGAGLCFGLGTAYLCLQVSIQNMLALCGFVKGVK
jgi:hypothetical protein